MKIINQPQFLSKKDYDDELSLYLQNAEDSEGLISILTMGSVGAPGLSDLDLICVVKEDAKANTVHTLDLPKGAQERGILLHGPILIPKSLFSNLHYIFPVSNLIDCSGESLLQNISPVSNEEEKSLALAYLVDFTLSRLLQHSVVQTKKISVLMHRLVTKGLFVSAPEYGVYWKIESPFDTEILITSGGYHLRKDGNWIPETPASAKAQIQAYLKAFLLVFSGNFEELQEYFTLSFLKIESFWMLMVCQIFDHSKQEIN